MPILFFLASLHLSAQAAAPPEPAQLAANTAQVSENQAMFLEGVEALFSGDYQTAAQIFEALYARTGSERVRLEWARSMFLLKDYHKSEQLFRAVLATNPPLAVQENIRLWLEDIQDLRGRWDFSLELVSDTNPRFIPASRQFFLFGQPFTFQPEGDTDTQFGLAYRLAYSRVLDQGQRWVVAGGISGREFAEQSLDRIGLDFRVGYRLRVEPRIEARVFTEHLEIGGRPWSAQVGVALQHSTGWSHGWKILHEARHADIDYHSARHLSGANTSYELIFFRMLGPLQLASLGFYFDETVAREKPYSSYAHNISASFMRHFPTLRLRATLRYTIANRDFQAKDPFFAVKRRDRREIQELELEKPNLRIWRLRPAVVLRHEDSRSSIPLHTFSKTSVGFIFRKSFN